eukprot:6279206-Lingulodinium_polyedra.AAC.1
MFGARASRDSVESTTTAGIATRLNENLRDAQTAAQKCLQTSPAQRQRFACCANAHTPRATTLG